MIKRYAHDSFEESIKDTKAEVELLIKFVDKKRCKVTLWDLGTGDSSFTSLTNLYCRDAVGAIVIVDCTSEESIKKAS